MPGSNLGIAIEHRSRSRVGKTPAPAPRLDQHAPRPRPDPMQDIAVIRRVDDLGPVRQARRPVLRRGRQHVDEARVGSHGRFLEPVELRISLVDAITTTVVVVIIIIIINSLFGFPLLASRARRSKRSSTPRTGVDETGSHLAAPG